jgi:replicative DNA helicase
MARPKALPHSAEAERAVLGALLLEPLQIARVRTCLELRDWHIERHRQLYQAFLDLADAGSTPDRLTLQAHLQLKGTFEAIGGLAYLAALDLDLPDLSRLDEYVGIVKDRSVKRDLIAESLRAIAASSTARPAHEIVAEHHDATGQLLCRAARVHWIESQAFMDRLLTDLEDDRSEALRGLSSGFPAWDKLGPGFLPGGLYVIAGRPGMGKTSLALDLTRHVVVTLHKPVGVFSLEMHPSEVAFKLGSAEADVAAHNLRTRRLSTRHWQDLFAAANRIAAAPLFLDHSPSLVLRDLESRAWWLKANQPDLALLVVDFLQLVAAGVRVENRRLEIAHLARRLKELAGELELPLIALSQLNREVTRRSDPRPQLADLAESDAIGQFADQVAFVHRPEVYNREDETLRGVAELIIAKHRHGETGTVQLTWIGATTTFRSRSTAAPAPVPS